MYTIKKCTEVPDCMIFQAFTEGFADYIVQTNMEEDFFLGRFFGPEGNRRDLSYIAFKGDKPIGVCLGGYKTGEQVKTLRCGGLAIVASERGTGLGKKLMELHEHLARELGCKQLFLEVIENNEVATRFYKKFGYDEVYHLTYRTWQLDGKNPIGAINQNISNLVETITYEELLTLREEEGSHLPWQGEFEYFKTFPCHYYGIREDGKLVAGLATTKERLYYIWVRLEKRRRGYGRALMHTAIETLQPEGLRLVYSNNAELHTFANHYKMQKGTINLYEMYKWLD